MFLLSSDFPKSLQKVHQIWSQPKRRQREEKEDNLKPWTAIQPKRREGGHLPQLWIHKQQASSRGAGRQETPRGCEGDSWSDQKAMIGLKVIIAKQIAELIIIWSGRSFKVFISGKLEIFPTQLNRIWLKIARWLGWSTPNIEVTAVSERLSHFHHLDVVLNTACLLLLARYWQCPNIM